MSIKKRLTLSISGLILSIAVFATVVFAWFTMNTATSDFIVETGNMDSDAALYVGYWDGTKYDWEKVESQVEASKLFERFMPGQIITFYLELNNKPESTVDISYDFKFGDLLYDDDIKTSKDYGETTVANEDEVHLFNAVNVSISEAYTALPEDAVINGLFKPGNDYKPDASSKKLSYYLTDDTNIAESGETVIAPGKSVYYILKFYFNPVFQTSSNVFKNQGFKVDTIKINFYQKHEITELQK